MRSRSATESPSDPLGVAWTGAQKAYAEAIALAPDLPAGCYSGLALAKYDEALKYAPNWKQLKEAREATAKQKS
jgi:hypothetical protein